ncbi:hypothetical protein Hypma_011406 [Hypsizygus marmoreus]|uniref:Uncharacterized protein n=1 Tax=Hypsizygus marmoreus TaxID=39966 RepID=A0A369JKC6_HYPMA|nr:hypothetical protein Hypma_011406 [Hypsizygus marmoreus]
MAANLGTRSADIQYLARNAATTGYQLGSLLAPPLYMVSVIASRGRSSFTINRLLRATWLCGLGGSIAGGAVGYAWYTFPNEDVLRSKRLEAVYDNDRIRADDHAMIGTILMGVLTPALFWNRAHIVNLVLGGAGLGSGIGLLTHYGRSLTGDRPPKTQLPVLPFSD